LSKSWLVFLQQQECLVIISIAYRRWLALAIFIRMDSWLT